MTKYIQGKELPPDGLYGMLHSSYKVYTRCHEKIKTKQCIASLQSWYQHRKVQEWIRDMRPDAIRAYIFPEAGQYMVRPCNPKALSYSHLTDRNYRESVRRQRHYASAASRWHKATLPVTHESLYTSIIMANMTFSYV